MSPLATSIATNFLNEKMGNASGLAANEYSLVELELNCPDGFTSGPILAFLNFESPSSF